MSEETTPPDASIDGEVPPPPDDLAEKPKWARKSDLAALEEKKWADESDISGQKRNNQRDALKSLGAITQIVMWMISVAFIAMLGIWLWHLLVPTDWRWLEPDNLNKIQSVIFSGAVGGILATYARDHILR